MAPGKFAAESSEAGRRAAGAGGWLSRVRALESRDWRLLAEAALWLVTLRAALWFVPVRRLAPWCGAVRSHAGGSMVDVPRLVRRVEAAARRIPGTACLPRSLALTRMLAVRGIRSDLRMGVRTDEGRLTAHAWVEHNGRPLNDAPDVRDRFEPLDPRVQVH